MTKFLWLTAFIAVVLATACSTQRSRDTGNPKVSALSLAQQVCSNCHGVDGHSVSPNFPNLAGQQEQYLVAQLKGFRSQNRSDPAGFEYMWGLSKYLTDDQIAGLAAYFAQQKPFIQRPGDAKLVARGQEVFQHGVPDKSIPPCSTCHGEQGQGNAQFPRLATQHADYLVKQLRVFQRTDARPEGAIMKEIAHNLTSENIAAVAAYLESLPN
jgi:cytochrome c553